MSDEKNSDKNKKSRWIRALICLLLLGAAGAVVWLIFSTEPEAVRETATRETAMLVEVVDAEKGDFRPVIRVMGTVVPAREVMLRPRVGGRVLNIVPPFTPGGVVEEDETLLTLDPAEYRIALRDRESALRRAEAALALEEGRREVARQDVALMERELPPEDRALALREPQMKSAEAAVEAARAAVERAELHLKWTTVEAPFRARILERLVNRGSEVGPRTDLARLVDVDTFWVEATVPQSQLAWLEFPEDPETGGVETVIHNETAWPPDVTRTGRLSRLVGTLADGTRMARILVTVDEPLRPEKPPLLLGSFVTADIPVRELPDVVRLKRDYVRQDDTVWVMREGKLDIREVEVAFRDRTHAYITDGLEGGEQVVTTRLAAVVEGARLRTGPEDEAEADGEGDGS